MLGYPTLYGLVDLFYVDEEANLPTAYQFLALLSCSVVMAITPHDSYRLHWKVLAIVFACLAFDELAGIHELTMTPMERGFGDMQGIWSPKWVIPGLIAVAAVGFAYLKFLFHLERREQVQVVAAAALFVGGAAGVEMLTGALVDNSDPAFKLNLAYASMTHVEEAMEMFGILVFLDFLLRRSGRITLATEAGERSREALHRPAPAAVGRPAPSSPAPARKAAARR
ncbi:MAG: hypothetical protein GEU92_12140 [Alphaproteobacteria bacterium]|nr:hypothetical protein [Alphaproteobacteria bacterium]